MGSGLRFRVRGFSYPGIRPTQITLLLFLCLSCLACMRGMLNMKTRTVSCLNTASDTQTASLFHNAALWPKARQLDTSYSP